MKEIHVATPVGKISIAKNPDEDYPGVWIKINGQELMLVDYDKDEEAHFVRVWTKKRDEEGDDPIAKINLESEA